MSLRHPSRDQFATGSHRTSSDRKRRGRPLRLTRSGAAEGDSARWRSRPRASNRCLHWLRWGVLARRANSSAAVPHSNDPVADLRQVVRIGHLRQRGGQLLPGSRVELARRLATQQRVFLGAALLDPSSIPTARPTARSTPAQFPPASVRTSSQSTHSRLARYRGRLNRHRPSGHGLLQPVVRDPDRERRQRQEQGRDERGTTDGGVSQQVNGVPRAQPIHDLELFPFPGP